MAEAEKNHSFTVHLPQEVKTVYVGMAEKEDRSIKYTMEKILLKAAEGYSGKKFLVDKRRAGRPFKK